MITEPRIHSHIEDGLPDDHPLAEEVVVCRRCKHMVHACNNEAMTTWLETGNGNFCFPCFVEILKFTGTYPHIGWEVLEDEWGLDAP